MSKRRVNMFKREIRVSLQEELSTKLATLNLKTSNALSVFKETLTELTAANEDIDATTQLIATEVAQLEEAKKVFEQSKLDNEKVINKIKEFVI